MSLSSPTLEERAARLIATCATRGLTLATAESCTGGLVAAALTSVPGASAVFLGAVVAYSNAVKIRLLGVPSELLAEKGAVNADVARAMARGACEALSASLGLAVTGIAGPAGGTPEKPVGRIHIAVSGPGARDQRHRQLDLGNLPRHEIRLVSAAALLDLAQSQFDVE